MEITKAYIKLIMFRALYMGYAYMPRPNNHDNRQGRQDLCMGAGGYESSSSVLQ